MIAEIEIRREHRRNALDTAEVARLRAAAADVAVDPAVRAVVLCSAGEVSFCAGQDVKELASLDREGRLAAHAAGQALMEEIAALPCLVVAAVEGFCFGGGLELALACDLRVAGEGSRFALPEVARGLLPTWGAHHRLAPVIGMGRAKELVLAGRELGVAEALDWGLVTEVAPQGAARQRARSLAERVATGSTRHALATAKRLMSAALFDPSGAGLRDRQAESDAEGAADGPPG